MNERYYKANGKQFAQLKKNWCKAKKAWKGMSILFWCVMVLGLVPVAAGVYNAVQPTVPSVDAFVLLIVGGVVVAIPIYLIAYLIRSQTMRILGKPYSAMQAIFLYSNRSGIQFGYHDRYDRKWMKSAIVHQIAYENIHHVEVDDTYKLLTVIGRTERVEYSNLDTGREAYRFTSGQFGDMASFSFFLCFEDEAAFFAELTAHGVKIEHISAA